MRLLEFSHDNSGANPAPAHLHNKKILEKQAHEAKNIAPPALSAAATRSANPPRSAQPISHEAAQLQQRISMLEQQVYEQRFQATRYASVQDIKHLKKRLGLLERALHSEMTSALARDNQLQSKMDRLDLKARLITRLRKIWQQNLPAIGRWLRLAVQDGWIDHRPLWWSRLTTAWYDALHQARH